MLWGKSSSNCGRVDSKKKKNPEYLNSLKTLFGFSKRKGTEVFIFKLQLIAETHTVGRMVCLMHVLTASLHGRYY